MRMTRRYSRPNTRKLYEEHYNVIVPPGFDVHHKIPLRHGGTHTVGNLEVLARDVHALAHLELYNTYGDVRDLCAYYMLSGRTEAALQLACSRGGLESQRRKKLRGDLNGFQLFSPERRKEIASKAGKIGGTRQKEQGKGIHAHSPERQREVARMGAIAAMKVNGWTDTKKQSERGKKGGPKNKGFKWCNDGTASYKFTTKQAEVETFEEHLARTGRVAGRLVTRTLKGARFYNDGSKQFMFVPDEHEVTFDKFLAVGGFHEGRLR